MHSVVEWVNVAYFSRMSKVLAAWALLLGLPVGLSAQTPGAVWQVEEEWELVLAEPDTSTTGPQITCTISPLGNLSGQYGTFDMNHRSAPTFRSGGVHLHTWNGETRLGTISKGSTAVLNTTGETITWTTIMTLESGVLTFDIDYGASSSWGSFGDGVISSVVSTLGNLNQYSPDFSADNSGIGFASNRVSSLKLKKVTYHRQGGQTVVDNTVRVIHAVQ